GAGGTEGAIVSAAANAGIPVAELRTCAPRSSTVPFDSVRREMRTLHRLPGRTLEVIKGAPEVVLPATGEGEPNVLLDWTSAAYRVLAVAAGPPGRPELLGMLALADPVRADARRSVTAAQAAGIRTVMITG